MCVCVMRWWWWCVRYGRGGHFCSLGSGLILTIPSPVVLLMWLLSSALDLGLILTYPSQPPHPPRCRASAEHIFEVINQITRGVSHADWADLIPVFLIILQVVFTHMAARLGSKALEVGGRCGCGGCGDAVVGCWQRCSRWRRWAAVGAVGAVGAGGAVE